jgi:hypothetical protein
VQAALVILGCSQRKSCTSRLIPAIDRYDGPVFRVFRKRAREAPEDSVHSCVLSGRFGLIHGSCLIPRYDRRFTSTNFPVLRRQVEEELKRTLDDVQPERMFVSVGRRYWPLIEEPLAREVTSANVVVATGGIGGRASHLAHWLRLDEGKCEDLPSGPTPGEAVLLGTTVRLTRAAALQKAREKLVGAGSAARRFETWYVAVGDEHVAPKWLVSVLFDKPVARFRTADARRVLSLLGVPCVYARY